MAGEDIETSYQAAVEAGKINGAVICATNAKGDFMYEKTFGERTLLSGEKRPQQLDDGLYLASATKLLAAIAALQCVDDGLLSLTGDLSAVAPELQAKQVLTGFAEDGETPLYEPQGRPITLEMLLTHSAGLNYHFLDPLIGRWREKFSGHPKVPDPNHRKTVEELINYPLAYQPGSSWMYGPSLDWAGRIVERVTGETLCDRLHERVFQPLGIRDGEFYPVTNEDLRARLVDLNPSDPECLGLAVLGGSGEMNLRTKGDFGGHGLFMTGPGYIKVLQSILANDGKILRPETVNTMFDDHLNAEATAGHEGKLASPLGPFIRVGTAPKAKVGYGLSGLLTLEDTEGWYGKGTLSWGGGLTFAWFIDRQNDLCGMGAVQAVLPFDGSPVEPLKQIFRHDIYCKHAAWKEQR